MILSLRTEYFAAVVIVVASFVLFSLYSIVTPVFEASDELWHYPLVQHLATGGSLPVQRKDQTDADAPWRQEGSQPPLYYWLAAAASAPFDSSNWRVLRRINPHSDMGVPTHDGNANAILHTPAEAWPWAQAALAVHVARFVSILMSTATVAFSYWVARELFCDDGRSTAGGTKSSPIVRLAVPIFVASVPMFAFISGAINNDNAAVLFSTIGLWWALHLLRRGDLSIKSAAMAGVISGLGALSKSSALGLVVLFGVAASLTFWGHEGSKPRSMAKISRAFVFSWFKFCAVLVIITFAISGWWFVRNQHLYGDLLGWNAFLDVVGRRDTPSTLAQLWTEREGFIWAYWGVFGTLNVIMQPWVYGALNTMLAVAGAGASFGLIRRTTDERGLASITLRLVLLCAFWFALVFVALVRWSSLTPASQGRLLFPCIAVVAALMAYGLWRIHRSVLIIGCGAMFALAIVVPFEVIAPVYSQPANNWTQRLPITINAILGDAVTLVEGGAPSQQITPGDAVTLNLNWQLMKRVPKNYSVFVHLIDENDVIVAQRDTYPGQGNLALYEQVSGRMWSDHYTLRIPALSPAPKMLRWAVGVYDFQSGARLKLADGNDRVIFGSVELMTSTRQGHPLRYANGIELLDYMISPSSLKPGETMTVTSHWRATRAIAKDLTVSLQLLDDGTNKIAQQDLSQSMTQWKPDYVIEINHVLELRADAPSGVYRLLLVMYDPAGFARTSAYDAQGQFVGDQIVLTRVRVR